MMHTSNAKHRKWEECVRSLGCCITGDPNPVIHHPVGRKGKHNKELIGPWLILPLREDYHVNTPYSIHGGKSLFIAANGKQSVLFFERVLQRLDDAGLEIMPPLYIRLAIEDWGK